MFTNILLEKLQQRSSYVSASIESVSGRQGFPFDRLESWLMHASILLAFDAAGWTLSSYALMGWPQDPLVLGLVFLLTFFFYNRDRLTDCNCEDDRTNMEERSDWISARLHRLRFLVNCARIAIAIVLVFRTAALLPILGGLGFALSYNTKFLPGNLSFKQLPGLKAPYVAGLWTLTTFGIPLAVAGGPWNSHAALIACVRFCLILGLINLADIRDVEGDRLVGTMTLPVLWGERPARIISLLLAVIAGTIGIFGIHSLGTLIAAAFAAMFICIYDRSRETVCRRFKIPGLVAGLAALCFG